MKIDARSLNGFLQDPDPAIRIALFFGPDQGLVLERAKQLGKSVVEDLSDPFAVVDLAESDIKEDPVRLGDEARAMSFGGGRRLVRVRGGGEAVAKAVALCLENPGEGSLIIIEAGELIPKSGLRASCEKSRICAVVGCYADEGRDLAGTVRSALSDAGVGVDPEAVALMAAHLANDRGVVRSEIEKLVLYVGEGGHVGTADVEACMTDAAAVSVDSIAFACGDGDTASVDQLTRRALDEGISEIAILRILQQHFLRLEWVAAQGASAVEKLRPPVFFRLKDRFRAQAGRWPLQTIRRAQSALTEAEINCKSSGEPAALICSRALLAIASWAPGGRGRR